MAEKEEKKPRTDEHAVSFCFCMKGMIKMTQEEKWLKNYEEVVDFIGTNHRTPSKHRLEEHDMLSWVKQQRKLLNAGKLRDERLEPFQRLLDIWEENKRVNQYQ